MRGSPLSKDTLDMPVDVVVRALSAAGRCDKTFLCRQCVVTGVAATIEL